MSRCDVCRCEIALPEPAQGADVTVCGDCFTSREGGEFVEAHRRGDVFVGIPSGKNNAPRKERDSVEFTLTFSAEEQ